MQHTLRLEIGDALYTLKVRRHIFCVPHLQGKLSSPAHQGSRRPRARHHHLHHHLWKQLVRAGPTIVATTAAAAGHSAGDAADVDHKSLAVAMAAAASTTMSSAQHALHIHDGLESQQAQHYEDLDGAFAAEVAARATAQAQAISSSHDQNDHSESLDNSSGRNNQDNNSSGGGANSLKHNDIPRNADGRIMCPHPSCAASDTTFDRKCEWTKHMDKHERPYVCDEPGCEKLRGFTYSGGLLRHQREVHKKHGGPKEMLMCPFPYCKRNVGTGFTRKENLHEHIRRVHRGAPEPPGVPTAQQTADGNSGVGNATNGATNGSSNTPSQDMNPTFLASTAGEDLVESGQRHQGDDMTQPSDTSDYLPHDQHNQHAADDRLVALQRSVQSYVPHSSKSRKRKNSSQVHDDAAHYALLQPHQQHVQDGQQHNGTDEDTDLENKLDLLRNNDTPRLGLGQDASDELEHLRDENRRLRIEIEDKDLRLRELESVVQFMTQQQELRA